MLTDIFTIPVEGSLPTSKLCMYLLEDSPNLLIDERPLILLCPGGGYTRTSDREAEPLAMLSLIHI